METVLFYGLVTSCFGMAYMVYGKKQQKNIAFFSGLLLCLLPYFVDFGWISVLLSLFLCILPFYIRL